MIHFFSYLSFAIVLNPAITATAFQFPLFASSISKTKPSVEGEISYSLPRKVAVTGATGRTGSLVVKELLNRQVSVVALVRDLEKANALFSDVDDINIVKCDLASESEIENAVRGCNAGIWCATGFSDAESSIIDKLKKLFDITFAAKSSIDAVGVPKLALCMNSENDDSSSSELPKIVMLSSAGVTRPSWSEEKKKKYPGAADIPIVRLNPFNILNIKAESEEKLRATGVKYSIVRPCGLNDKWPSESRPVFSQGDVGVGRINRKDVAKVLVDTLIAPEAVGKTFEVISLAGYPASTSIRKQLGNLYLDEESSDIQREDTLSATYNIMQQLLPGEKQDAAALAMGQTYEQLDKNEEGRFGARGTEDIVNDVPINLTS